MPVGPAPKPRQASTLPQARRPEQAVDFKSFRNYVALPRSEAFRIEYWALEEAKLQRAPAEKELSRKVALVVGAGSGIGREVALRLAARGAHVAVTDLRVDAATAAAADAAATSSAEHVLAGGVDLKSRESIRAAVRAAVLQFGGIDILINTAAVYPTPPPGTPVEQVWATALQVNVTSNHVLAEEAGAIFEAQGLPGAIVLTSSANAIVPKYGSEPYDVSKAALNHLIRELAMRFGPLGVRVNGIAPATVVAGSAMFPRDRVIVSLEKYAIPFSHDDSTETLQIEAGGVLRPPHHHTPPDPAGRLRQRDSLAGRRRERQDDRPHHPGRRRSHRGLSEMTHPVWRADGKEPYYSVRRGDNRKMRL